MKILSVGQDWQQQNDRQLNALHNLLSKKHPKEKVLIFSQFSDTADYLYEALSDRGVKQLACVTGDTDNPNGGRASLQSNQ